MKQLSKYLAEKLIINKDYRDNTIVVKSFVELKKIIDDRYDKLGPGTEQNPIDFNDIDVSNIDSFYSIYEKGIFEYTRFKYIDISDWDVSNIKSMRVMFCRCYILESVGDISKWDVSKVTDMSNMFSYCSKLKSVGDISKWDVSNVTDMERMFYDYCSFNQDISCWNVSNVRNNYCMFENCPIKEEYKPKFK